MTWLESLILGIVQGLTEFLPVSSSGHLEIGSVLFGIETTDNLLLAVVLHAATALSTVLVLRREIATIILDLFRFRWNDSTKFTLRILISIVPVGIVGILFESQIEQVFTGNLLLVGSCLIFTSFLLILTSRVGKGDKEISSRSALIIGLAQAIAILPGISRSGATISTALLLGVEKTKATHFSFLMVLIPIFGAAALKLKDYFEAGESTMDTPAYLLIVGFVSAFVSGYIACRWMIGIVRRGKLSYFAIYCFVVGLIAILSQLI